MTTMATVPQPESKLSVYVDLARPITVLMPMVGFLSGSITGWGSHHTRLPLSLDVVLPIVAGVLMAGIFNAGSNSLNQIYDLEIDPLRKPTMGMSTVIGRARST